MRTVRSRAAVTTAALVALAGLAGVGAFVASHEDSSPASTTSTSMASTTTTDRSSEVAAALATTLQDGLPVELTVAEAQCVADGVVAVVPPEQLEAVATATDPLAALDTDQRAGLLRAVVTCLPPATAGTLLGDPTSTTVSLVLPNEGG
jgi:hypothetical protein